MNLLDGVALNLENPDSFEIPSEEEKARVKVGDFVKIGFKHNAGPRGALISAERMWVQVTGPGVGVLDNDPVVVFMTIGDKVKFKPKNILSILSTEVPAGPQEMAP